MPDCTLHTDRLRLRPCTPADAGALHTLWTDPEVRRYLWDDLVIERKTADEAIAESQADFTARGFGHWAVMLAQEPERIIGGCGLRGMENSNDVELIYALAPDYWGQGYADEASRAVLAHAFDSLEFPRVYGRTDTPNLASQRVLERLGMARKSETLLNDLPTTVYVLTRDTLAEQR